MYKFSLYLPGIYNLESKRQLNVFELSRQIRWDPNLKRMTEELRSLPDKGSQNEFKKNNLPFVSIGGMFTVRKDDSLIKASGLVCVDLDEVPSVIRATLRLIQSPYLVMLFVSPRGNGLKAIFRCNPKYSFKENYKALSVYLIQEFEIPKEKIDDSCAHISKACFLCHDPKVWLNEKAGEDEDLEKIPYINHSYFHTQEQSQTPKDEHEEVEEVSNVNLFEQSAFQYFSFDFNHDKRNDIQNMVALCRLNIRNYQELAVGCRHNWFLKLAMLTNQFGTQKETAIKHCKSLFSNHPAFLDTKNKFDEKADLLKPFDDVYAKYADSFGTWTADDKQWETPILADEIFQKLPVFFKRLTNLFESKREKDVFFLSLLTFLSTCFPRIKGVYDNRIYSMNLFLFVSAPAASGKGVLAWVRKMGESIHSDFLDRYNEEIKKNSEADEEVRKALPKPVLKKLFIPANNTSARMISSIHANEGKFGIIMDTEADVLTNSNKSEHGAFSELLRKAFQNEAIDYERKGNSEYLNINDPAISILISGTPNQVKYLMRDLENGLTSRFMYYSYSTKAVWKDVFESKTDFSYIFKSVSVELAELVKPYFQNYLFDSLDIIRFKFAEQHQTCFNNWFAEKLKSMEHIYGEQIRGSVLRMGLIFFRISMVLTAIRNIDSKTEIKEGLVCSDDDFAIANSIIATLLHHTAHVFNQLKSQSRFKNHRQSKEQFFDKLPIEFQRQQAIDIANLMQIKEKTAESYLSRWVEANQLVKIKHNNYQKAQQ